MSNNSNRGLPTLKPVIYHNGLFHYVENNNSLPGIRHPGSQDNGRYSLFQIYNLNRSFKELESEIIKTIEELKMGEVVTVKLEDDLSVRPIVDPDSFSSSPSNMEDSYVNVGGVSKKVRVTFRRSLHRDVVEGLRSSETLKSFTENGFADWIPLDLATYNYIERSSKCDHHDHGLNFRSFSDEIDEDSLNNIIEELISGEEESALRKLFPGSTTSVHREVNDIKMTVFFVAIRHYFEFEFGRLHVEVLNAIVEDRKINVNNDAVQLHHAFFRSVVYLMSLICYMLSLSELYGEFKYPSWTPFVAQRQLKLSKEDIPQEFEKSEQEVIQTEMNESDEPFVKLHSVVKQLRQNIEYAQEKLQGVTEKWSAPKKTTNLLLYSSMASAIAIPAVYLLDRRLVTANNVKSTISCILSFALGCYAYTTREKFHRTIIHLKSIEPILASADGAAGKVDKWIENIANITDENEESNSKDAKETNFDKAKLFLDDDQLSGRRITLKRLFDAIAILSADLRRSLYCWIMIRNLY